MNATGTQRLETVCLSSTWCTCKSLQAGGLPQDCSAPTVLVFKYGSTSNHQRVRGLECRTVQFGFDLGGKRGGYKKSGEGGAVYLDNGKSERLSAGNCWGQGCILVRCGLGRRTGSWRRREMTRGGESCFTQSCRWEARGGVGVCETPLGFYQSMQRGSDYSHEGRWPSPTLFWPVLPAQALWSWANHLTCSGLSFPIANRDEMKSPCEALMYAKLDLGLAQ